MLPHFSRCTLSPVRRVALAAVTGTVLLSACGSDGGSSATATSQGAASPAPPAAASPARPPAAPAESTAAAAPALSGPAVDTGPERSTAVSAGRGSDAQPGASAADSSGAAAGGSSGVASGTAGAGAPATSPAGATEQLRVGDATVTISCSGTARAGQPTVVLLAGMPDPLTTFAALQRSVAASARVCSYDRLGEGTSSKPAGDQQLSDIATFLGTVLAAQGINGPVLLVGHSLGGLVAAKFAELHPQRTAGLVLVDATPPSMQQAVTELIPASAGDVAGAVRGEMTALQSGENPERLVYDGAPVGSIGDVPLVVMRHGKPIFAAVPKYGDGIEKAWQQGQQQWLKLSTDSRMVVAPASGHYIYRDQPELVHTAITDLLGD